MVITFISGKGGTGKTTVSTNLAALHPETVLMDCDVEEPNAALFMEISLQERVEVTRIHPFINEEKCTCCRACSDFCRFNAILSAPQVMIPMRDLCHSCGGCAIVCREDAIEYRNKTIGSITTGTAASGNTVISGILNAGEYSGVPVIRRMLQNVPDDRIVIVDGPPGTSCTAAAALEVCDLAVLVTEPTPFALSDMKMAVEMIRKMSLPLGVVINKSGPGDREIYQYCLEEDIPVLGKIPFSLKLAKTYAEGRLPVKTDADSCFNYSRIWSAVLRETGGLVENT